MNNPTYFKVNAQVALDQLKAVAVRLRAIRDAKTFEQADALRVALKFDASTLNTAIETLRNS